MSNCQIRYKQISPRTKRGSSTYHAIITHLPTGEVATIKHKDRDILDIKAKQKAKLLHDNYLHKEDLRREKDLLRQAQKEQKALNHQVKTDLEIFQNILANTQTDARQINWEAQYDAMPFTKPHPSFEYQRNLACFTDPRQPVYPTSTSPFLRYTPGWFQDYITRKAQEKYTQQKEEWAKVCLHYRIEREKLYRAYKLDCLKHQAEEDRYYNKQRQNQELHELLKQNYERGKEDAVAWYARTVLYRLELHPLLKLGFDLEYQLKTQTLLVNWQLPAPSQLPSVKEYLLEKSELIEKPFSSEEKQSLYSQMVAEVLVRISYQLYRLDYPRHFSFVVANGWREFVNPVHGRKQFGCVGTLKIARDSILDINPIHTDARRYFQNHGGYLHQDLETTEYLSPIANFSKTKFSPPKKVAVEQPDTGINLARIDPYAFEGVIKKFLQLEHRDKNIEIIQTKGSRDRGVDLIVTTNEKYRPFKILVQVKRYKDIVPPSYVRDLVGTLRLHDADRGILITTSRYGPDSYADAKKANITLIDGPELLEDMRKHGLHYIINYP